MRTPTSEKKTSDPQFFLLLFRRFCHADVDSREQQAILLKKVETFSPKLRFSCFSGEKIGTILSRRSRLSRTSRAPSRLSRPRPIDCDREPEQTVKTFVPVLWGFEIVKTKLFQMVLHLVLIYTPKEAHSRVFVTGGFSIRATNAGQKNTLFLARPACNVYCAI